MAKFLVAAFDITTWGWLEGAIDWTIARATWLFALILMARIFYGLLFEAIPQFQSGTLMVP